MNKYVYFELNDWAAGQDYPVEEAYDKLCCWQDDPNDPDAIGTAPLLLYDNFLKENQLVVTFSYLDMSMNFCVVAKREWVEEKYPALLTTYQKFICHPYSKDDDIRIGRAPFRKYKESNFNCSYYDLYTGKWHGKIRAEDFKDDLAI